MKKLWKWLFGPIEVPQVPAHLTKLNRGDLYRIWLAARKHRKTDIEWQCIACSGFLPWAGFITVDLNKLDDPFASFAKKVLG